MHAVHELHIYIELRYLKHKLVELPEKQTSEIVPFVIVPHISESVFTVFLFALVVYVYLCCTLYNCTMYRSCNRHVPLNCSNPFYFHTLRDFQESNKASIYLLICIPYAKHTEFCCIKTCLRLICNVQKDTPQR
jgi:hypothetical protein